MKQLLKFSATWCAPCKALSENIKHVDMGDVEFKEIDIDENLDVAKQYGIRGVPTLVLLEDGEEIGRKSGVHTASVIEEFING